MNKDLKFINSRLSELNSTLLHPSKSLSELTLPKSGYTMLFMNLHLKYRCFPLDYVLALDPEQVNGQSLLDRINETRNSSK